MYFLLYFLFKDGCSESYRISGMCILEEQLFILSVNYITIENVKISEFYPALKTSIGCKLRRNSTDTIDERHSKKDWINSCPFL